MRRILFSAAFCLAGSLFTMTIAQGHNYSEISRKANFLFGTVRLTGLKKTIARQALKPPRSKRNFVSSKIIKSFNPDVKEINSRSVVTLKSGKDSCNKHIIFFHGGGYVFEIRKVHWRLLKKLSKSLQCRVSVLEYPLAPESNFQITHEWVSMAYNYLSAKFPGDVFVFIGDSAGAGLALSFSQTLAKSKNSKQASGLVLLSPWLDMSMSNPDIQKIERLDYFLSLEFLDTCSNYYSNGEDKHQFKMSPINGSFAGLPKTIVFYGTNELFYPDCIRMHKLTEDQGSNFIYCEYGGMQHDWLLFPIVEAQSALKQTITFIESLD